MTDAVDITLLPWLLDRKLIMLQFYFPGQFCCLSSPFLKCDNCNNFRDIFYVFAINF